MHVERRPADDLQNIGGRRLLFQGFGQLPFARLLRLEQPGILDGDDSLVGEGLDQGDLPSGERLLLFAGEQQQSNKLALT